MKQANSNPQQLADLAFATESNFSTLEQATTNDLVRALGLVGEQGLEEDEETLLALDEILSVLDYRSDLEAGVRSWLGKIRRGVSEQL